MIEPDVALSLIGERQDTDATIIRSLALNLKIERATLASTTNRLNDYNAALHRSQLDVKQLGKWDDPIEARPFALVYWGTMIEVPALRKDGQPT